MPFHWFEFNPSRYTVSGIFIGVALVALVKAWLLQTAF